MTSGLVSFQHALISFDRCNVSTLDITILSTRIFYLINNKYVTHTFFYLFFIRKKFSFLLENTCSYTYFLLGNRRLSW